MFQHGYNSGIFSLCHHIQTGFGAHPASCPMDTGDSFPGVKWLGCEADHTPSLSAEVKTWGYDSTPPCLHGMVLS